MRKKFWTTQRFRKLQETWDKKLAATGFKDIESPQSPRFLKQAAPGYRYKNSDALTREARTTYYELIGHWFHVETFQDPVHELIMSLKKDGLQHREISERLRSQGFKNSRETIRVVIRHYEHKWGIKKKN